MSVHRTDFLGLLIHHRDKVLNAAVADIIGDHHGSFVDRLNQHRVEQIVQYILVALIDTAAAGLLIVDVILNIHLQVGRFRFEVVAALERHDGCHNLCQGRRVDFVL